jgi:hypothetical protein
MLITNDRKVSPMRKKFAAVGALVGVLGLTLGMASVAGADVLQPSTSSVTMAPVASTTVGITLVATSGEWGGDHGCDLKNGQNVQGHFLDASVTSGDTAVATVDQSVISFTDCGQTANITIRSVGCGDTAVAVAYLDSRSAGGVNAVFSDASIAVHVGGCGTGSTTLDDCASPAAPAWAAAILQANGIKGSNKGYSTLITSVAHAMLQGAAFPSGTTVVSKSDQAAYSAAVYAYMLGQNQALNLKLNLAKGPADAIRPGWVCQHTSAV